MLASFLSFFDINLFGYTISEHFYLLHGTLKGLYLSSNHCMQFQYPFLPLVFYAFVLFMVLRIKRQISKVI